MDALRYITSSLVALVLAATGTGQSRAYAKFDSNGRIIGLFNLANGEVCREVQTVTGTTRNVRFQLRQEEVAFSFTLVSSDRSWIVGFSLKSDAISRGDVEALLIDKRHLRVSVRACRSGGRWVANDITRQ